MIGLNPITLKRGGLCEFRPALIARLLGRLGGRPNCLATVNLRSPS